MFSKSKTTDPFILMYLYLATSFFVYCNAHSELNYKKSPSNKKSCKLLMNPNNVIGSRLRSCSYSPEIIQNGDGDYICRLKFSIRCWKFTTRLGMFLLSYFVEEMYVQSKVERGCTRLEWYTYSNNKLTAQSEHHTFSIKWIVIKLINYQKRFRTHLYIWVIWKLSRHAVNWHNLSEVSTISQNQIQKQS